MTVVMIYVAVIIITAVVIIMKVVVIIINVAVGISNTTVIIVYDMSYRIIYAMACLHISYGLSSGG